jgi:hypothetical protein
MRRSGTESIHTWAAVSQRVYTRGMKEVERVNLDEFMKN